MVNGTPEKSASAHHPEAYGQGSSRLYGPSGSGKTSRVASSAPSTPAPSYNRYSIDRSSGAADPFRSPYQESRRADAGVLGRECLSHGRERVNLLPSVWMVDNKNRIGVGRRCHRQCRDQDDERRELLHAPRLCKPYSRITAV